VVGSQALLQKQQQQEQQGQQGQRGETRRRTGALPPPHAPPPPLNALETLVYVGAPASFLLLLASLALREGGSPPGLLAAARAFARANPFTAAAAVASSALVNFSSMAVVRLTSSLTFKVSGCAKNAAVMALAAAEHGDTVAPGQVLGYAVATAGFVAYAVVKGRQQQQQTQQQAGREGGEAPPPGGTSKKAA
jgi:hypothetical protein